MIDSRKKLYYFIKADSKNYSNQNKGFFRRIKNNLLSNPVSDQKYIWNYIKNLRYLSSTVTEPVYAHKDVVDYNKSTSDIRYADLDRKLKEEKNRIRQTMADMQRDMNQLRIELAELRAKGENK